MNNNLDVKNNLPIGTIGHKLEMEDIGLSLTELKTGEVYEKMASSKLGGINTSGQSTPNRFIHTSNNIDYYSNLDSPQGRHPSPVIQEHLDGLLLKKVDEKLKKVVMELEGTPFNLNQKEEVTPPLCLSPEGFMFRPKSPSLSEKFSNSEGQEEINKKPDKKSDIGCSCIVS